MNEKLVKGAEFFRVSQEEFATLNKAANEVGLKARIFELAGEPFSREISFELVERSSK